MKALKKTLALLLALVMLVGVMTVSAFAEDASYKSYQIFTASQANDGKLGNVKWSTDSINANAMLTALKNDPTIGAHYTDAATAIDVAKILDAHEEDAETFAKLALANIVSGSGVAFTSGTTVLQPGYYLIVDESNQTNGTKNLAVLAVSKEGPATVEVKATSPTFEKKLKDINDSTDANMSGWQDTADHDIGDAVPFRLTATLGKIDKFDTYKAIFHDTLSQGLTYNEDAKFYVGDTEVTGFTASCTKNTNGSSTLTFACNDIKSLLKNGNGQTVSVSQGQVVAVEYTATLNSNAVLGSAGNPNDCYLEFSNNPNKSGSGNSQDVHPTSNTPVDEVIVYTYSIVINKTDESGNALPGAAFTLSKKNQATGNYEPISTLGGENGVQNLTTFTWTGIDDGEYKLHEAYTPKGYNTADDITFTVAADHTQDPQQLVLTSLSAKEGGNTVLTTEMANGAINGLLTGTVVNEAGAILPETGGAGTTLIYVIGGLMLVGGGILLVTKRRMER